MRRTTIGLLLLALLTLAAGASGTVTDSATLAVDECAPGPDAEDVMLDAHDVCDATVTVTSSVDAAPVLEVAITTADALTPGSDHIATLSVGECLLQFRNAADVIGLVPGTSGGAADLFVGCGEPEESCTFHTNDPMLPIQSFNCTNRYEDYHRADVQAVADGNVLTLSVEGAGDHARLAQVLVPGAEVEVDWVSVSADLPASSGGNPVQVLYCDDLAQDSCTNLLGDLVFGEGRLVLSNPADA